MSKKFLLSFLIVCAINVITCYLFCSMYRRNCDVLLLSGVKAPIRMFLKGIQEDLSDGNIDNTREKINFLSDEWEKFYITNGMEYDIGNLLVRWEEKSNKDMEEEHKDE